MFALTDQPIDAEAVRAAVLSPHAGAVVVFHGTVRDRTRKRAVTHLEYEAYPEMAITALQEIGARLARHHGLTAIACVHRVGRLEIGESALVLAASAPHRAAALAAIDAFVVFLKRDVPIWKKEHFEGGAVWVGSPEDPQGERSPARPTA